MLSAKNEEEIFEQLDNYKPFSNCGIKIAFPIQDSEKSDLQRLHEIQKRYSNNRLAYLHCTTKQIWLIKYILCGFTVSIRKSI